MEYLHFKAVKRAGIVAALTGILVGEGRRRRGPLRRFDWRGIHANGFLMLHRILTTAKLGDPNIAPKRRRNNDVMPP